MEDYRHRPFHVKTAALEKPAGAWTKIGIAIAGLILGWVCYSIASNTLTYMHTAEKRP
jgi:hypothetical protein